MEGCGWLDSCGAAGGDVAGGDCYEEDCDGGQRVREIGGLELQEIFLSGEYFVEDRVNEEAE